MRLRGYKHYYSNMKISVEVIKSEEKYLSSLESFFKEKWGDTKLWSHDLSHHKRVWEFAKELLHYAEIQDNHFIGELLIACFLHDLGMSADPGERHGHHSRKLCEEFLSDNNMDPADYADLLEAIENHDNKEYTDSPSGNNLLQLLSVADDLDAFGYTGIYRYLDIYRERGIKPEVLIPMVLKNAANRYNNLKKNFSNYPELIRRHHSRYIVLSDFFENLHSEISGDDLC